MQVYTVDRYLSTEKKEKVAELFMQQISVSNTPESREKIMAGIDLVVNHPEMSRLILAEKNDEIYGLALLNTGVSLRSGGNYIWLNELLVKEEQRNQGIGKKLLMYIIHFAESENIKTIELETGVNNSVTKHLYNSLGFYEVVSKRYAFRF